MIIGPRTAREPIIADAAYLQGFEEGVRSITERLRQRDLKALAALESQEADSITNS